MKKKKKKKSYFFLSSAVNQIEKLNSFTDVCGILKILTEYSSR